MGIPDFPTALGLAAAVRSKELSPSEVLEETIRRVEERNPAINAVIWRDDEDARTRAKALDDMVAGATDPDALPPFLGVPLPIKDLNVVAGQPCTYGSNGVGDEPREESEPVVLAFERGGFLLHGRTNTPEFGPITAAENARYGITRNPWNTDHTPGGSSGGAAAATAAGIFAAAHANDGGGSIRIPASCCGLVGLKASRGRIPMLAQSWEGAVLEGVVTRTVADTAAIFDVLTEPDPLGWWAPPPKARPFAEEVTEAAVAAQRPLRVAVVTDAPMFGTPSAPACVEAVQRTVAALEAAGHTVVDAQPDFHIEEFVAHFINVVNAGLGVHDDEVDWSRTDPHIQHSREAAGAVDAPTYVASVAALQRWTRAVNAQWGGDFDVLVTPTMAIEPPPAGQILGEVHADPANVSPTVFQSVLFTAVFNMNGLPAISLPLHQSDSGLPIGVQIVGGPWRDDLVLRVAAQLEQALPWADRHPDLTRLTAPLQ